MSNNYRQFSEELILTVGEAEWVKTELDDAPNLLPGADEVRSRSDFIEKEYGADLSFDWPDFNWDMIKSDNDKIAFWFYSEEHGNIEHVAGFLSAFFKKFRPDAWVQVSWADTCSKPRIGEFGGGSVYISAEEIKWFDATALAQRYGEARRSSNLNRPYTWGQALTEAQRAIEQQFPERASEIMKLLEQGPPTESENK